MSNKRVCVVYDTVDEMFNDIDITETMLVMTLGRENVGDGKGGYYEITTKEKKGGKQWAGEVFPKDSPYFAKLLDNPGDYKLSRNLLDLNERVDHVARSKADISHAHSANDITSGTLDVIRGGTGATSYDDLVSKLGLSGSKITRTDDEINEVEGHQVYNFKFSNGLQIYCQRHQMTIGYNPDTHGKSTIPVQFNHPFLRSPICVVNIHTDSPDKLICSVTDTSTTNASLAIINNMGSSVTRTISVIAIGIAK